MEYPSLTLLILFTIGWLLVDGLDAVRRWFAQHREDRR